MGRKLRTGRLYSFSKQAEWSWSIWMTGTRARNPANWRAGLENGISRSQGFLITTVMIGQRLH